MKLFYELEIIDYLVYTSTLSIGLAGLDARKTDQRDRENCQILHTTKESC